MENVKACLVCLEMDTTLFNLHTNSLQQYYELLTGSDFTKRFNIPMFICFECKALLMKFYVFRQKSFRGQAVLRGILQSHGGIPEDEIRHIDKSRYLLSSNLKVVNVYSLSITDQDIELEGEIKKEIDEELEYDKLDDEKLGYDEEWLSDDEPLSIHKSRKSNQSNSPENVENIVKKEKETVTKEVVKKKTKKSKKAPQAKSKEKPKPLKLLMSKPEGVVDDMSIENYVTVVKLSEEEQHEEIRRRKDSDNYKNATLKCELCYKGFIDPKTWKHHMQKHDKISGNVECGVCRLRFKSTHSLNRHALGHARKMLCNYCPYVSRHATQAKHHLYWHQGVMYKCPYCDEMLSKWTSYLSHVRIKHPSDHVCGFCGYSFVSELGLAMHKSMMHKDMESIEDNKELPYCEVCGVRFATAEAFKRHMVTGKKHSDVAENKQGCRACGSSFATEAELRAHVRECERERRERLRKNNATRPNATKFPTDCVHCSQKMPNARTYWAHFRKHHPDRDYPTERRHICDVCGKGFRGNAFLVYHKRTHSDVRPFACAQCGKAFHNRCNLRMHARAHSDLRPHACRVCAKAFKSKAALDRHFRSHTGDKPYKCEVCGKCFGQSNSCKLHVRTVHLRQPAPYLSRARLARARRSPAPAPAPASAPAPTPLAVPPYMWSGHSSASKPPPF